MIRLRAILDPLCWDLQAWLHAHLGMSTGFSDACPVAAPTPHVKSLPSASRAALWQPIRSLPAEAWHSFGGGICSTNLLPSRPRCGPAGSREGNKR